MKLFSTVSEKKYHFSGDDLDSFVSNELDFQTQVDWGATGNLDASKMAKDITLFVKDLNKKLPPKLKDGEFHPTPVVKHPKFHSLQFINGEFVLSTKKVK